tara:strand:- start:1397 stop:1636 length:240 start_codon:yes stop_codon:yes gene_type:complete
MKRKINSGIVYPGLKLEVLDLGVKTLLNTNKEVHYMTFGMKFTRDLGNLPAKLILHKVCSEMEKICTNINDKELTKWWR